MTSSPKKNQTLVLIKPDGISKSLTGNILSRLAETKAEIVASKCVRVDRNLAEEHYQDLKGQPFFEDLISFILGECNERKKVLALVYYGEDSIERVRNVVGATNPEDANPVSIRGSYGRITTEGVWENVIHASASEEDAEREIKLWFKPSEIIFDLYPSKTIEKTEQQLVWE